MECVICEKPIQDDVVCARCREKLKALLELWESEEDEAKNEYDTM